MCNELLILSFENILSVCILTLVFNIYTNKNEKYLLLCKKLYKIPLAKKQTNRILYFNNTYYKYSVNEKNKNKIKSNWTMMSHTISVLYYIDVTLYY